jgi:hypothetical protein
LFPHPAHLKYADTALTPAIRLDDCLSTPLNTPPVPMLASD